MTISAMLGYGFVQRALIGGSLIAILCSVLGVFLVLRRLSLIGDGLAHVTFGSVAVTLFFRLQSFYATLAMIPIVLFCAMGILKLAQRAHIFGDAAIGIVSALGIATGVMLASVSGGFNVDLLSYLFGNILSITTSELAIAAALFVVVISGVAVFYNDLFASTFDEELARTSGIDTSRLNAVLVLMTALTVVLAMKVVGVMLISALLILPAATALQLAKGFKTAIVSAAFFGVATVVAGITLSFLLNLPTGATIVMINFAGFALAFAGRSVLRRS
jgi:zinc transport system permease protein